MIHLDNDDVLATLSMADTIDALRIGFAELARRDAAHVPRLELWSPAQEGYHCLGSMAGTSKHFGVSAIRIKSDVLTWPGGTRQEKYAVEPGTFCGFVLLFSTADGAPLALINDGVLQRMRVGASAGIAVDHLAPTDAATVGVLGSGDMARVYLEAIALVRPLASVVVYSPTESHRRAYAEEMSVALGVEVVPSSSPAAALADAAIAVTATNSMSPTIDPEWLAAGATVVCVTRREVGTELVQRADRTLQLGAHSITPEAAVPGMEWPQSAAGGFVAGSEHERTRLPWNARAEDRTFPSLIDVIAGRDEGRQHRDQTMLFINVGNQGVQFAAAGGRLLQLAEGRGDPMNRSRFLQNIRD